MTGGMVLLLWLVVGPIVCAAIASAAGSSGGWVRCWA